MSKKPTGKKPTGKKPTGKKPNKVNHKTVTLKLTFQNDSQLLKLFDTSFNRSFTATKDLFNEIVCWGNDFVYVKPSLPGKVYDIVDLKKKRQELYEMTDKSISFQQFENLLKVFYTFFVTSTKSRGMVSSILGEARCNEILDDNDWKIINQLCEEWNTEIVSDESNENLIYKIGNTLKKIGFRNHSPYNASLTSEERYIVIGNVHRMLTSWVECNKEKKKAYQEEESEIEKKFSEIDASLVEEIRQFFDFCVKNNIIKNFSNKKLHSYLVDCIIPELQKNTTPTHHFYLDKKGKKHSYSLHNDFITYLQNHPILWTGESPAIVSYLEILGMMVNHNKKHPEAFYPFIKESDIHRFQYFLGSNYKSYKLLTIGQSVEDRIIDDEVYTNGTFIDHLFLTIPNINNNTIQFRIHTKDKYSSRKYNPNPYFQNLIIWVNKKNRCTNLFQFTRKGKTVTYVVKEPSVVKNGHQYNIRINLTEVSSTYSINDDIKWFFSTALPSSKTKRSVIKESSENQKRIHKILGSTVRVLGVDLGHRNIFAWAAAETTITNSVNTVNKIIDTGIFSPTEVSDTYYQMMKDYEAFFNLYRYFKSYANENDDININSDKNVVDFLNKVKEYTKHHYHTLGPRKKSLLNDFLNTTDYSHYFVQQFHRAGRSLKELKKEYNFLGSIAYRYLLHQFKYHKNCRKYYLKDFDGTYAKFNDDFNWLKILMYHRRAIKVCSYLGETTNYTRIDLQEFNEYFNNCKSNFLKNIASKIVEIALNNNCQIIALENLDVAKVDSQNTRKENYLYSIWSPKSILAAIENAASTFGIQVVFVDETMTSQVHYESQTIGYRDGEYLYYLENDEVKSVNADINAAKNIALRCISRHASLVQVNIESLIKKNEQDNENIGKRLNGFLTHKFGYVRAAIEYFKTNFPNEKYVYLNGDKWITMDERKKIEKTIQQKLKKNNT